jgi:hypothetical protein
MLPRQRADEECTESGRREDRRRAHRQGVINDSCYVSDEERVWGAYGDREAELLLLVVLLLLLLYCKCSSGTQNVLRNNGDSTVLFRGMRVVVPRALATAG